MQELVKQIETLFNEMKEYTLDAGVKEDLYNKVIQVDKDITLEELQDRLNFLKEVKGGVYERVKKTYELVKPEVWQMYIIMGQKYLTEQVLLRQFRIELKKEWKKKYGSDKDSDWQPVDEMQIRSETTGRSDVDCSQNDSGIHGNESS